MLPGAFPLVEPVRSDNVVRSHPPVLGQGKVWRKRAHDRYCKRRSRGPGTDAGGARRFTRLTNAFSKKVENHAHSVALFALYYNFVRIHKTLRTTPAMAANVTERLWEMGDIVDVLEAWEASSPEA